MSETRTKRGWAIGIVAGFTLFVGAILTLVVISMSRDVDLVTDQYYDKELRYQERIRALERGVRPETAIILDERRDTLLLRYPLTGATQRLEGSITLYRPANPNLDRSIVMKPDESRQQSIRTAGLMPGLWRVKMEWRVDGVEYYAEKAVVVQ
jgi:hypothetical protein